MFKALLDSQRARLLRRKNEQVSNELRELISRGLLKRQVQNHFWQEIVDLIGKAYKSYDDAAKRAINAQPDFEYVPTNFLHVDLEALRGDAELAAEIAAQEAFLAGLAAELARDEERFRDKADTLLGTLHLRPASWREFRAYEEIKAIYQPTMEHWFKARDKLQSEHLSVTLDPNNNQEKRQADAMVEVLKRILVTRRRYALLEIFAPVAFAVVAIAYVYGPDISVLVVSSLQGLAR